jgi:hypothetical protein
MAAQTFTGSRAASTFPVFSPTGRGLVATAFGSFTLTEVPEVGDIYQLCKLPAGAIPIGGYLSGTDIDTGTETFDMDLGIAANGVEAADPDYFINSGVLTGDAITDLLAAGKLWRPIILSSFVALSRETIVQAEVIAVANAGGTGTVACRIDYTL